MVRSRKYQFHAYPGAYDGTHATLATVTVHVLNSEASARAYAGRIARRVNGPVDLAVDGKEPWEDRYITTARPSEFHVSGYAFERLT